MTQHVKYTKLECSFRDIISENEHQQKVEPLKNNQLINDFRIADMPIKSDESENIPSLKQLFQQIPCFFVKKLENDPLFFNTSPANFHFQVFWSDKKSQISSLVLTVYETTGFFDYFCSMSHKKKKQKQNS